MYTTFNLTEIRYIFKAVSDFATNIVTSTKNDDNKLTITNTSEQKVLIYGNKRLFMDSVSLFGDDEEWMIEIHDGNDVYEYEFPNEDEEDAVNYIITWLFNDDINELAFNKTSSN